MSRSASAPSTRVDDAVLVGANWYQFARAERVQYDEVASVCYLWAVHGRGTVATRGRRVDLDSSVILRLPWRHDVEYLADPIDPFRVGTLHLVPRHDRDHPAVVRVPFAAGDPLLRVPWRSGDAADRSLRRAPASSSGGQRLIRVGAAAIERFAAAAVDEALARAFGVVVADLDRFVGEQDATVPVALATAMDHARSHLDRPLRIADLAHAAGCSVSTLERLFRRHAGVPAGTWLRDLRLETAAGLLRETAMRVGEVADRVGFEDPLYFSRAFRSRYGVPPSRYVVRQIRP